MGISSTGILVFGFDLGLEEEKPDFLIKEDNEDYDFDDFLCDLKSYPAWKENMGDEERSIYHAGRNATIQESPVELVMHCSYDYPMYILAIRGTERSAPRGHPEIINSSDFIISQDKIDAAKTFCEANGLPWREPSWILCSIYG